jgi:hypothetical protein
VDVQELLSLAAGRASGLANAAGGGVLRRVQGNRLPGVGTPSAKDDDETAARRWRAVTILCRPEQVGEAGRPPASLAALGDRVEWRLTPAPADKGTELAARFRDRPSGTDLEDLRRALREAKQLIEVGEVLRVEPQPHGRRKPTPQGFLLDGVVRHARGQGVL